MTAFVAWLQHDTAGLLTLAAVSVAVLLLMIIKFKLEPFIALIVVGLLVGLAAGLPVAELVGTPLKASDSILEKGFGGILGHIAPIIGLGTVLGAIMERVRWRRRAHRRACCGCSVPRARRSRWGSPA